MEKLNPIGHNAVVGHAPGLVVGDVDGEKAMLNVEDGRYYVLDSISSRIWEIIEEPCTVRELIRMLVDEFDVQEEKCQHDVHTFLNKLYTYGLVTIA